jgi:SSS family solute:Na+ symporter
VAGGLAGLFLLGFLTARAGKTAAYAGIAASLLFTAWATLTLDGGKVWNLGRFNFPWHSFMIGVIGNVVLLIAGYVTSVIVPNRDPASRQMTAAGWLGRRTNHVS